MNSPTIINIVSLKIMYHRIFRVFAISNKELFKNGKFRKYFQNSYYFLQRIQFRKYPMRKFIQYYICSKYQSKKCKASLKVDGDTISIVNPNTRTNQERSLR
ncbi:hypothetical protein HZS_353 [Henneguya salminicola]|nr:hypothetical protein HZS_353 [Henneguya salminicola]